MIICDAHAHLQDARLAGDIEGVLKRASAAGIARIVSCGVSADDWAGLMALARKYPVVLPAFGVHPLYVEGLRSGWQQELIRVLASIPSAGVGEIGLDFSIDECDRKLQEDVFIAQLRIAADMARPVSMHCRNAWGRLLRILEKETMLPAGFMLHSYSGSVEMMSNFIRLGGWFSFSGAITREGNRRGTAALAAVPADRILAETDSPDMLPSGINVFCDGDRRDKTVNLNFAPVRREIHPKGRNGGINHEYCTKNSCNVRVNEPANLRLVVAKIALVRGMDEPSAAEMLFENFMCFFAREGCNEKICED